MNNAKKTEKKKETEPFEKKTTIIGKAEDRTEDKISKKVYN